MRLAPIGAFGAMAFTVGRYGIKSIGSLGLLIGTFNVACLFCVFVVLGVLSRLHGFRLRQLLRYIKEELRVVLGTSSSEPVLPRLLLKLERLGCRKGAVACVVVSIWEDACNRDVLCRELAANCANTEHELEAGTGDLHLPLGLTGTAH